MRKSWALPQSLAVHNVEWIVEEAIDFIKEERSEPFFLYVAPTLPHSPQHRPIDADILATPAGWLSERPSVQPTRESVSRRVADAGLSVRTEWLTWMDDGIGAILSTLDELGIADDTVVILMSDNGSRGNYTLFDGGARVPCFVRWTGHAEPGSVRHEIVANIDVAPTIFEIAGVKVDESVDLDGLSWVPLLKDEPTDWRRHLLLEIAFARGVVADEWKYIAVRFPERIQEWIDGGGHEAVGWDGEERVRFGALKHYPNYFDSEQLYNLVDDPEEQVNLADDPEHVQIVEQMRELLHPR